MLLKKGDNNEQVKQLQVKLGVDPVGNFGPKTEEAVKAFQAKHGLTADGIELVRKINYEYGNHVVVGIISSSNEPAEQAKAQQAGAQFWIIKSDDIEPRLEEFRKDYEGYKNRTAPFKVYK